MRCLTFFCWLAVAMPVVCPIFALARPDAPAMPIRQMPYDAMVMPLPTMAPRNYIGGAALPPPGNSLAGSALPPSAVSSGASSSANDDEGKGDGSHSSPHDWQSVVNSAESHAGSVASSAQSYAGSVASSAQSYAGSVADSANSVAATASAPDYANPTWAFGSLSSQGTDVASVLSIYTSNASGALTGFPPLTSTQASQASSTGMNTNSGLALQPGAALAFVAWSAVLVFVIGTSTSFLMTCV